MARGEGDMLAAAFAPTQLATFLGCRHAARYDLEANAGQRAAPVTRDSQLQLIADKGLEHEKACLDELTRRIGSIEVIMPAGPLAQRRAQTLATMEAGAPLIWQATLTAGRWVGVADALVRVDQPSARWSWSYEPWDAKLAGTAKPAHVLQLCLYGDLLKIVQGVAPERGVLMLGRPESSDQLWQEMSFRLADYGAYARHAARELERFAAEPWLETTPVPCSACAQCRWSDLCEERWKAEDHLCRVADIARSQIRKLEAAGIRTMMALAALDTGAAQAQGLSGIAPDTLARLVQQARLQKEAEATGQGTYELLPHGPQDGFRRIPEPDPADLFFDFEGDPLFPGGLEYLCGVLWREKTSADHELVVPSEPELRFRVFWAHDREGEKAMFAKLMTFLVEHFRRHPAAHLYHYAPYEKVAMRRMASMHGIFEAEVDAMLREGRMVDLYRVVREAVRVGERSYSIKYLERFYMEKRAGAVMNGGDSLVVYDRWRDTREPALLESIRDYNLDDVRSTLLLRDWLAVLALEADLPEGGETAFHLDDEDSGSEAAAVIAEQAKLEQQLLACAEEDRPLRQLLADLVGFHRREEKPGWWAFFDRQDRTPQELIDDGECLGGLTADGPDWIGQERRSFIFRYRYPPQDTKLKPGNAVHEAATGVYAGSIMEVDRTARTILLKRGQAAGHLPEKLCLIPGGPIKAEAPRKAVWDVAKAAVARSGDYRHVHAFLRREPPRIQGRASGQPIVPQSCTGDPHRQLEALREAVLALEDSWLFIQGPPGAGKTYTSSHLILSLLKTGRRVGISSNSHKAIDNLLEAVEKRAAEEGFTGWQGLKKSGAGEDYKSRYGFVRNITSSKDLTPMAPLIAGTAWAFADERLRGSRDVLFIDEAGQVSLGNLVAMATAARALILVGDQMQLGQPIQGAHPRDSGLSALEYLLQDAPVIEPERGVFLGVTWRMHPNLTRWVSDAVYAGALQSVASCAKQRLVLGPGAHPALKPAGVSFVAVEHEGNGQRSNEEAEVVARLLESLLSQRVVDRHGVERLMSLEDVLIVSPYNIQVNLLKDRLPQGARVGTVDKFQGQEAEVVIVTMATSSADEMPRDTSFLLNRNRLNVAFSRARCLAMLVCSPRLLSMPVRSVAEMQLANLLCWIVDYAGSETCVPDAGSNQ